MVCLYGMIRTKIIAAIQGSMASFCVFIEKRAYRRHIASVKRYKKHEANENNVVYASWLFHQYFDGLMTEGIIPCLLVRSEGNIFSCGWT
jgi:hypothetical protein